MIVGLGTDLVSIARIRNVYQRHPQRFLDRIYTDLEQQYCLAADDPGERLAARWAAKEAAMKVLGTGHSQGIRFTDIAVSRDTHGAPGITLTGAALKHAQLLQIDSWHVSLSHSDESAVAVVIGERIPS